MTQAKPFQQFHSIHSHLGRTVHLPIFFSICCRIELSQPGIINLNLDKQRAFHKRLMANSNFDTI